MYMYTREFSKNLGGKLGLPKIEGGQPCIETLLCVCVCRDEKAWGKGDLVNWCDLGI